MLIAIVTAVVVAFIGGLYFIKHHKKEETEVLPSRPVTGNNTLPPKPEERWRYIKELEKRQPEVVREPTEPTAGGEVVNPEQLTGEQRQLLAQIQADMRRQPTRLAEVPWNQQAENQRQRLAQQQNSPTQPPVAGQTAQPPKPAVQPKPVTAVPQPGQAQTPVRNPAPAKPAAAAPIGHVEEEANGKQEDRSWLIQCGSFKGAEQAETVRAQLAFEGFASRIATSNGWNRVVIGPLKGKDNVNNTVSRLKLAGHTDCIRLATKS